MTLRLINAPASEPVSVAEARLWARLDPSDASEDTLLQMLIKSARRRAEHLCSRVFTTQTWEQVLDAFPAAELSLETSPVESITFVKYFDANMVEQTMQPTDYTLDPVSTPAFVLPAYGLSWPSTLDTANAVRVRFVSGYGSAADDNTQLLKHWMQIQIATGYKFREQVIAGVSITEVPNQYVDRLLEPMKNWDV